MKEKGGGELGADTEGGVARLSCKARGFPQSRVTCQREDGPKIIIHNGSHQKMKGVFIFMLIPNGLT